MILSDFDETSLLRSELEELKKKSIIEKGQLINEKNRLAEQLQVNLFNYIPFFNINEKIKYF